MNESHSTSILVYYYSMRFYWGILIIAAIKFNSYAIKFNLYRSLCEHLIYVDLGNEEIKKKDEGSD